jgi:hypothetical protein
MALIYKTPQAKNKMIILFLLKVGLEPTTFRA